MICNKLQVISIINPPPSSLPLRPPPSTACCLRVLQHMRLEIVEEYIDMLFHGYLAFGALFHLASEL